ncbi:MAG: organic solvent tolerance protein OstA [Odoribacter sp.]|nr:organic solvent tolerance protein OstA [Odoribacter sp.]
MTKYFLLFFISLIALSTTAQEKTVIDIKHSDEGRLAKNGVYRLIGNVKLEHKNMVMTCDSLYQYRDSNYIEAFGRVHAIQNDTLHLWGDFLTYNGNTEQAKVRNHVIMKDPKITLTTDFLDYDAANRVGHYFNKGTIKDSINTLISDIGYYYVPVNEMFFKDSVKVYTPDYTMFSDTLKYQTETKFITILGPTHIQGDNRTLYSENGWYNSLTSHAELYKNNQLDYNNYRGKADTLVVDSLTGTALMYRNIHLYDTVNNILVQGHYGEVLKNNDYAFITQRALLTLIGETDSLFIHGDTLSVSKDTLGNNIMKAYHHTKFFSQELQGVCDSMVFPVADSTVYLYRSPVVWASGNQMTATDIDMHIRNNQVDKFRLNNKAMIVNQADSTMYKLQPDQQEKIFNQIKGRNITGFVRNNELRTVLVDGNGEAIYYPDDKGIIIGLYKGISSVIRIELLDKKIQDITFINKPEGSLNPLFMVQPEDQKLKDFEWRIQLKPVTKEDIFKK